MTAATSGGLGDIVYAIPVLKKLGVTRLYVKVSYYFPPYGNLYLACRRLLELQGIEALPTSGDYPVYQYEPGLKFDYDLDAARRQPMRGYNHIIRSYLNEFKLSHDGWNEPWLKVEGRSLTETYVLIHYTSRWRKYNAVDWQWIVRDLDLESDQGRFKKIIFVGFKDEYDAFMQEINNCVEIEYQVTEDLLDLACLVRDAHKVYCNQSVVLTLAQGLGKKYFFERNAMKSNCMLRTQNEHILPDKNFPNNETISKPWC